MRRSVWLASLWSVPAVMLLVAGSHAVRVAQVGSSPWIGAAFGMFATVDGHHRIVRVLDDAGNEIPTTEFDPERLKGLANDPTPDRLVAFLQQLPGPGQAIVLRPVFDAQSDELTWEIVAQASE